MASSRKEFQAHTTAAQRRPALVSDAAWPSVMILIGLLRELLQLAAQLSPTQIPAEYITQNRMAKQRFFIPFVVGHEFLLHCRSREGAQHDERGGPRPESSSVGSTADFAPEPDSRAVPGWNCAIGQARRRLCNSPPNVARTAASNLARTFAADFQATRISPSNRLRCNRPCFRVSAGRLIPSRDPSQPHKVGDINNCARHRRRVRHSLALRPKW